MSNALTTMNQSALVPTDMRSAMDLATMMAKGNLVPQHLQGQPGNCLLVIEQSMRWGMSPFAVAQETSVIQGKIMNSGKLVAAAVNASGVLASRLRETFSGEGNDRTITLSGVLRGETEPRTITVRMGDAKTSNQMWTKQPDQQLVYFATRAWARRHVPEVMLGVYSPEEFDEPRPTPHHGPTIEARAEPVPTDPMGDPAPRVLTLDNARNFGDLADALLAAVKAAGTVADIEAVTGHPRVVKALELATNGAKARLDDVMAFAAERMGALMEAPADDSRDTEVWA